VGAEAVQFALNGVISGFIIALVALGFAALWAAMRIVNLAQPSMLAVGALVAQATLVHGVFFAFAAGILLSALVGIVSYYISVRPTLKRDPLTTLIATLGFGGIVQGVLVHIVGTQDLPMSPIGPVGYWNIGGVIVTFNALLVVAICLLMLAIAVAVLTGTRLGLAFRANAWAPEIAQANGINVERVRVLATAAACAYTGLAGIMVGSLLGSVSPYMGLDAGLNGMVAMLIGGAGSIPGAVLASLLLGLLQAFTGAVMGNALQDAVGFALMVVVLLVRPGGLLRQM